MPVTIKEYKILKQTGVVAFTGGFRNVTWRNIFEECAAFVEAKDCYRMKSRCRILYEVFLC
jgi:hypothetical protein